MSPAPKVGRRRTLAALSLILVFACRPPPPPPLPTGDPPGHFVLAHTNDLHAHFLPNRAEWLDGGPKLGGFDAIGSELRALRATHGESAVLYLDSGDILSGTPLMEFPVHGVAGGAMLDLLDAAGCGAWAIGNHELDRGWENLAAMVKASPMPALSANLHRAGHKGEPAFPGQKTHEIFEVNGLRVGVFGLTTTSLARLASKDAMDRILVEDLAPAARREVALLEPEVDLVVALTHVGLDDDRRLAAEVDGIDLIVGGHTHTRLVPPVRVKDTWIVQAGAYARQLGVAELQVEGGRIVSFQDELRDLWPDRAPMAPPDDLHRVVREWQGVVAERFDVPIGSVEVDLTRDGRRESPIGRFAAAVCRSALSADLGLYNGSGVRGDLVAGPITLADLYEVFPFPNEIVSFHLTGSELVQLLLSGLQGELSGRKAPLQWSGLSYSWRERLGSPELVTVEIGGKALQVDATYSVATNSFVAEQWASQLGMDPGPLRSSGVLVLDAAERLVRQGPLSASLRPSGFKVQ